VLMNGTDHSRVEQHVPAALARAAGRGFEYRLATLADYERAVLEAGIDEVVHEGELRSPDRSNVLVGVLSARVDIKQRDFQVSGELERYAEPLELLAHLHGGPDGAPALKHAWLLLLENSPHDSICGCSVDQTHREMFPRYDRAEQLAQQVARESMAHVVRRTVVAGGGGVAVFRPVPHAAAVLEADVPDSWAASALRLPDGSTVPCAIAPGEPGTVLVNEQVTPQGAIRHLDFLREGRYDVHYIEDMRWELKERHLTVRTTVGPDITVLDDEALREEVRQAVKNNLADTAEVIVRRSGRARLRAVLPASVSVGVEMLVPSDASELAPSDIAITPNSISNSFYELSFRKGRLRLRDWQFGIDLPGLNVYVDEGDRGDEYNADILPGAVIQPLASELLDVSADAVSATLRYMTLLEVPAGLNRKRSRRTRRDLVAVPVLTEATVWAGLPRVDFRVTIENTAEDHRLRALFPLPFAVDHATNENQFHVAERSLTVVPWNGISAEQPPTTFPQKTFAAFEADGVGVAVFNKGLQEGEVVRDRKGLQAYALTLLRCVGWLSRPDLVSRRGGAGPTIATPDAQMQGEHIFEYALTTYRGGWREAGVQGMAHSFAYPPLGYATDEHEGALQGGAILATFGNAGIVPSAMHRSAEDGSPVIRVYNASGGPAEASISLPGAAAGTQVDLLERPVHTLTTGDGPWRMSLRPWEIASLRFERQ
jgi:mannosylglycerate hydrolase